MNNRVVLQSIAASAANLSLFNSFNKREGFEVKKTEIKEGKENIDNVILTPFQLTHGNIAITYFQKEHEIMITCGSEIAQSFAEQMKGTGELLHTNTFISINRT